VAVWAGNFDATPMLGSSGVTGAAPIMRQVFQALYPNAASPADVDWYEAPKGVEERTVCALSGQKPGHLCPSTRLESFAGEASWADLADCEIHRTYRVDTRNGLLAGPDCPDAYVEEREFLDVPDDWTEWALERGHRLPPTQHSPLCGDAPGDAARAADLRITHPMPGDTFVLDPSLPRSEQQVALRVEVPASRRDDTLTWFVDGEAVATVDAPFRAFWKLAPGEHAVGVGRGRVEASVTVRVE
jgi:penicillin-binding protein 1C